VKYFLTIILAIIVSIGTNLFLQGQRVWHFLNQQTNQTPPIIQQDLTWSNKENTTPSISQITSLQDTIIQVIQQEKKSVVSIIATKDFLSYYDGDPRAYLRWLITNDLPEPTRQKQEIGGWSGIFADKKGYIITNKHVLQDIQAEYTVIFSDGSTAKVEEHRSDPVLDIAIAKINPQNIPTMAQPANFIGFDQKINIGQLTLAIGNALNEFQNSVTLWIISGRNRKLMSQDENVYAGLYQTDAAISEGNSGGPLLNLEGQVIGINTAVSSQGTNIGFAIPVTKEFIQATLSSIQRDKQISRPFIGIQYTDIDRKVKQAFNISSNDGIVIIQVVEDSPADLAWLQKDDIITHIDGRPIDDDNPFLYQLFTYQAGDTLTFSLIRGDQVTKTHLTLTQNTH